MKAKKTVNELVKHMESKGITFNHTSKEDAEHFLSEHTYFLKFSSYRKNYEKVRKGKHKGKYLHLDFNYLKDLSTIDMHLRYLVNHMCLDIEHSLRTKIIHEVEKNSSEDGYSICASFLANNTSVHKNIERHRNTSYCARLIDKYNNNYPVWVLCEVVSFGELIDLYKHYRNTHPSIQLPPLDFLYSVKNIRNAAAHNNCLINDLHQGVSTKFFKPSGRLRSFLLNEVGLKKDNVNKKLSNQMIHDFIALLCAYDLFVANEDTRTIRLRELRTLFDDRILRHKDYYQTNDLITSTYHFCSKILGYFFKKP